MSHSLKTLVLAVLPGTLAVTAGTFALLLGFAWSAVLLLAVLVFAALSVAAWIDLIREKSPEEVDSLATANFLIRELAASVLPFALVTAWVLIAIGFEATLRLVDLVFPFAVGTILGRAAIEFHYFRRASQQERFPIETVFYDDDRHN